jgi:hypothetical protein
VEYLGRTAVRIYPPRVELETVPPPVFGKET